MLAPGNSSGPIDNIWLSSKIIMLIATILAIISTAWVARFIQYRNSYKEYVNIDLPPFNFTRADRLDRHLGYLARLSVLY